MKYIDRIYGEFEIKEPVILDLINSPSLQRLKWIDQIGYRPLWVKPNVEVKNYEETRFAHSLGVYLLLRKYGAPIEEKIAGLIHDVSHSAFSHCIDYVLDSGSEKEHNYQDNIFENFVKKTEIPKIIKKYGFNLEYILNDKNFPLKERDLPDLCADRIDYSLRTAILFNELNERNKEYFLENLEVESNNWIFRNFESAKKYAELFFKLNKIYYSSLSSAIMFRTVGDCLKHSLRKEYISEKDLYTTDEAVLEKIKKFLKKDKELRLFWERMNNKIKTVNNPKDYDAEVFCKSRIVDPLFRDGDILRRVLDEDLNWKKIVKRESKPKQYFLKFDK